MITSLNTANVGFSKYVPHKEGFMQDELARLRREIKSYKMKVMISKDPSSAEVVKFKEILRQKRIKYNNVLNQLNRIRMKNKRRAVRTVAKESEQMKYDIYADFEENNRDFYNDSVKVFSGDGKLIKFQRKFSSVEYTYRTPVLDVVVY
jgi:hypothetical protein